MNLFRTTALSAALISSCFIAQHAAADTILGIYAGAGAWNAELEGNIGKPAVDMADLGADRETNTYFYIALEHPIPLIPNIKLQYADISSSQQGVLTNNLGLDGTTFLAGQTVSTDFDLSFVDATLYYEILDNWLNLDIGFTARKFDGHLIANSAQANANVNLDITVPMFYSKAQFDLPFTGFSFAAEGNYASYQDNKVSDISAKVSYTLDSILDAGLEAGWRSLNIKVDDDGAVADVKLTGPYIAAIFHF